MTFSFPVKVLKLWDHWNIRGFIILSLSVQAFLILCAPLRKRRWGKWGKCLDILIWSAYLLADWIASIAIGCILNNKIKSSARISNIQVFWAPFLLLHLGGPDTITSFALEDNEFWVRHLLGLALQFGSTLYVFILSLPENKLWLPTLLVLIAGIIKYAERNRAFYFASFDHLGGNWVSSDWDDGIPIPAQFKHMDNQATFDFDDKRSILWSAVHHFGSIKRILVGPFLSLNQCSDIRDTFLQEENSTKVLQILEIELSLLYEVLHTKLPVVDCITGYGFRFISLVCVLGALFSFWFFRKHYELVLFDMLLTCVLLIGALLLDFISVILLSFSDWMFVAHFQRMASFIKKKDMVSTYIRGRKRWSRVVSQLNFITYHITDHPFGFQSVASFLHIKSLLEAIKGIRCLSSKSFGEDQEWQFIFNEVRELNDLLIRKLKESSKTVLEAKEVWLCSQEQVLKNFKIPELTQIFAELDYTKSILTWHIATELCFQGADGTSASEAESFKYFREICKRFSDYMFYLAEMQPNMMAAVSVNWKTVFEDTLKETESIVPRSSVSDVKVASKKILQLAADASKLATADSGEKEKKSQSVLRYASKLASQLRGNQTKSCPWKQMSKVWVQLMCFAAINCRPNVHAQQPSKGGELLTFVWLFMNHLGLGTHFSTHY